MASEAVRRVQGLRRSNAAQPRPGKRRADIFADPWDDVDCPLCGGDHTEDECPDRYK
jgi:hypothetical protein